MRKNDYTTLRVGELAQLARYPVSRPVRLVFVGRPAFGCGTTNCSTSHGHRGDAGMWLGIRTGTTGKRARARTC